jgi:hypothetical protein
MYIYRAKEGYDTSTVALRVLEDDEKGRRFLEV